MAGVGEALSIHVNNRVYEMQAAGEDVTVLSLGEAFFDLPLLPMQPLFHYSHSRGLLALRERIAAYYGERYGVAVDPEREILVTAGSKIAIHMTLMTLVGPGDEVVVPEPAWVSYVEQVHLCHGVPRFVAHDAGIDGIEAALTERTRVVIVNSPNNPGGRALTHDDWARLHDLAEARGVTLLCDEAYSDFLPPGERFVSGTAGDPGKRHTVVVNSISKNLGMSGWRIGYAIADAAQIDELLKVNQHLVTCPATILSDYVATHFDALLDVTAPQIAAVVDKRAAVVRELDRLGIGHLGGTATFYVFAAIAPSRLGSEAFCARLLDEHRVAAVPGVGYGPSCDGHIRLSVGTEPMERVVAALEAIRALIDQTA
jgi:aminotransferase